ncbi:hypoxanthine phosphoribosyltransferase [Candidatus Collierbacteria bacterium]|nr:hypoxanthine phosphoribosyltransferase [Candidatus Collierbacteria bacterium]
MSESEIRSRLEQLAIEISQKYQGKRLLLIGVLNGAFVIMADLSRELFRAGLTDIEIDFVQISSYGADTESSRNPRLLKDCSVDISGRHIMIVEDIVDTGYSLAALLALFTARGAASIETFALLSKPSRREIEVEVEYVGFEVGDWVEGMGLDTNQSGRANPDIVKVTKI